ncbi:MAG TPA: glycosyltransferase [Methylomirabilota bacterium]|nr:glycosyltransferase [Methylomirabilota bacterium]
MKRICVVTAGHLSTCPRMLKAADALAGAGYRVRLISTRHVAWAFEADRDVCRRRAGLWEWTEVDYSRRTGSSLRRWSGMRFRAAQAIARAAGPERVPRAVALRGYARVHPELVAAITAEPADLVYGGTTGALAAVAEGARRIGAPYALDLEDLHSAEQDDSPEARLAHALAARIERTVLHGAAFLTTSSPAIAAAYAEHYGVYPRPIHNTFPLPARAPEAMPSLGEGLSLYWFSQTIGPHRGLEDVVRAMGTAEIPGELHLRGRPIPDYLEALQRRCDETAPRLKLVLHPPLPPDDMVESCAGYDAGLSLEQGHVLSRALCLTNKAFTYILAGLPVVFTDTPGQRPLAEDLGAAAWRYPLGDVDGLAAGLRRWSEDKPLLARAKAAAWEAARRRWHWEHPDDRGALLEAVAGALR